MSRRSTLGGLSASPVLVGAVTLLVTLTAVFLAYNANSGLPFVPTYDLTARLPNAANLVRGNDVRLGGSRVGAVASIAAVARPDGSALAEVRLKLDKELQPLPADSSLVVRPRSALGLKYIELRRGRAKAGLPDGSLVPVERARPAPVELDELLNAFDAPTRRGAQGSLEGFGEALAGRGQSLNAGIAALRPLLDDLQPVAANLAAPETRLGSLVRALGATAAEVAPVAEAQASLFVDLDTTFAALASVARPFLQEAISQSPPTFDTAIREFPRQRPFLRNTAALFRELRPGLRTLPASASQLADAVDIGRRTLQRTPPLNRRLARVFDSLAEFSEEPLVGRGVKQLTRLSSSLRPTLSFLTPVQTRCNYVTLWFRNISSLLSEGDSHGTWQRFIIIAAPLGPNDEGGPSRAPANGGGPQSEANHLHSNPYPNTASPGQTRECEAGNEVYRRGQTTIGNLPGDQGTKTSGQRGSSISSTGGGR